MDSLAPTNSRSTARRGRRFKIESAIDSDQALVDAVATVSSGEGEPEAARQAFLALYDRHAQDLLAYIARIARSSAVDDIAQDVWRKAWERLGDKPPQGPFRPWLFTVARNQIADSYRDVAKRRAQPIGTEDSPDPEADNLAIDQGLLDEEVRVALAECLTKLDSRTREVACLRWRGEDYPAVCETLGIDSNQAYKAYHKAVRLLGECLKRSQVT